MLADAGAGCWLVETSDSIGLGDDVLLRCPPGTVRTAASAGGTVVSSAVDEDAACSCGAGITGWSALLSAGLRVSIGRGGGPSREPLFLRCHRTIPPTIALHNNSGAASTMSHFRAFRCSGGGAGTSTAGLALKFSRFFLRNASFIKLMISNLPRVHQLLTQPIKGLVKATLTA